MVSPLRVPQPARASWRGASPFPCTLGESFPKESLGTPRKTQLHTWELTALSNRTWELSAQCTFLSIFWSANNTLQNTASDTLRPAPCSPPTRTWKRDRNKIGERAAGGAFACTERARAAAFVIRPRPGSPLLRPLAPCGGGGCRRSSGASSSRHFPMEEAACTAAAPDARTSYGTATKAVAARAQDRVTRAACVGV